MGINKKIQRCFGIEDGIFASHPSEELEALNLLNHCFKKDVPLSEIETEVTAYLKAKPASAAHIKKQIMRVRERLGPWLT